MSDISEQARAAEAASRKQAVFGVTAGAASYVLWALNVIFYKQLTHVDIFEVLGQRTIWAFVFIALLVTGMGRWPQVMKHVRDPKTLLRLIGTSITIGSGWFLYIWMVSVDRAIEVSIGQFMAPLGSVLAGMVLLRERPGPAELAAVILATIGVVYFAYGLGYLPLIAIYIPFSFVAYTYLRKTMQVDALDGLLIELAVLAPFGLVYIVWIGMDAPSAMTSDWRTAGLLLFTGPMTVAPLLLFVYSARHISLTTLGFLQYIVPTGTFLIAVLLYGEPLTVAHMVTFGLIWLGLIIFTADAWRKERALRRAVEAPVAEPLL